MRALFLFWLFLPGAALAQEAFDLELGGETHRAPFATSLGVSFGKDGMAVFAMGEEGREWLARTSIAHTGKTLTVRFGDTVALTPVVRTPLYAGQLYFGPKAPQVVHEALLALVRRWSEGGR